MTSTHEIDWTGRVLRLRVEGPAQGGEFVARHEGRVVFCRGGITGEVVDVRVDGDPGRSFCRGTVQRVVEASADRIETYCPAAAAGAGCCDWSHIRAEAARGFSGRILAEQAGRIGRITVPGESVPVEVPAGDGAVTGWRTVARWVSGPDGVPGVRRARSRELVTQPCVQADPRLLEAVRAAAVGPHREILGVLGDDGEVHLARRPLTDQAPRGRDRRSGHAAATRARARHSRAEPWETVAGPSTVVRRVGGHAWRLPIDAFWQAHRSAAGHYAGLVGTAVTGAPGLPDRPTVWDLYGGAGLFSAAVLDVAPDARVTVVESARSSLGAVETALGADVAPRTVLARVESFLEESAGDRDPADRPDLVVLDPPRGGAGIPVMTALAARTRSRIVHVGCDPASLARDVGVLVDAGWTLVDLRGVAAFPGTHHVEGLAVLDSPRAR
ncbi:class I SAM-dependent RNA methyltransferase [uncultured Dietzia sp.]|uniref:class I SAM-dependent RNA methyltransferase n=1 Tax=uncultured Dietzia sp. TaxID=395519 RepID=UPI00262B053E|nr:TRAM domain-containing protein [uncultured Dietzia sp.]